VLFTILCLFFPSLRPPLPSGLFSSDDFHLETVRYYDLTETQGTATGWEQGERVLLCAPLRDASPHLPMFFSHLKNLTYPHNLIDLAFLVGDSKDNTDELLTKLLNDLQENKIPEQQFGEISILRKDFGQKVNQDVESRHGFAAQASRRKSMAQARNWLLSAALRPTHSWVYWRDVDVETAPTTILEDLMRHNKDVIVPSKLTALYAHTQANQASKMYGVLFRTGSAANNPMISTHGKSPKQHWPLLTRSTKTLSSWKDMLNMLLGDHILPIYVTHLATQIWRWTWMVLVESVFWQKRRFSVLAFTSRLSALRSTLRRRGSERYVVLCYVPITLFKTYIVFVLVLIRN